MQTTKYVRKPFYVEAVQVTPENIGEVAHWCGGEVIHDGPGEVEGTDRFHIKVPVRHPLNKRQTEAHFGEWVLQANGGFKVYLQGPFERNFDLAEPEQPKTEPLFFVGTTAETTEETNNA